MGFLTKLLGVALCVAVGVAGAADPKSVRWTFKDDRNPDLSHVLERVKALTGITVSLSDLLVVENRNLANTHFTMLAQTAGKVPIKGNSIRIWTSLKTGDALQVEARVQAPASPAMLRMLGANASLSSEETMRLVRSVTATHRDDARVDSVKWEDFWEGETLVRVVKAKAKHGTHVVRLSIPERRILSAEYVEFPQAGEINVPVKVYPYYEELEETASTITIMPRIDSDLRYVKGDVADVKGDPYAMLKESRYLESKLDPVRGLTVEGRKEGYWAPSFVKMLALDAFFKLPTVENSYARGLVLEGRYATVNLHPDVTKKFAGLSFVPKASGQLKPDWRPMPEGTGWEWVPMSALLGKPITSEKDALDRPARRLPNHDPASYINDGFDELQVYWAVNQMFDSLRLMGFTDPELSTRRFHAFLYDPDITYRDNAFYTDDTINFTTYSPKQRNMARDNSTIWHELGHGVMDRLMGDLIVLADTGGLSEGMADFVAQLVLFDVSKGEPYPGQKNLRIYNKTGFSLTNEVHDDGESYGGSMNDVLTAALKKWGRPGLTKVTDMTLEAMRYARNHPGLTANDWFNKMLFADEVGNPPVREPGELRELILTALAGRNFNLDGAPVAKFTMKNGNDEVTSKGPGSRDNPIPLKLSDADKASFDLSASLAGTPTYAFQYPVKVRVGLRGGPLQGAIHWHGEENTNLDFTLNSEAEAVKIPLTVDGKCDEINRPDGSCVDYAYVQIWNAGETWKPVAKKRFYLRILPKAKP